MEDGTHYRALAAAYARGRLGVSGDDDEVIAAAEHAELRMHRFKRNAELPRVRRVLGMLRSLAPSELLDVGSGRGTFLWPLLDELPWLPITAVDVLDYRARDIRALREGGIERVDALHADVRELPLDEDSFDGATALEVLEHMHDSERAARELMRVARRFVIATVPSEPDENPEHVRLFDERSLAKLFEDAGARSVRVERVRGHLVALALRGQEECSRTGQQTEARLARGREQGDPGADGLG